MDITSRAIEAAKHLQGREIVIRVDADFTPTGKRRVKLVKHTKAGKRVGLQIRWYVGNIAYKTLPLTNENIELSNIWKSV